MEDDLQTLTSLKICLSKALHAVYGGWFANSDFPQNMSQQSTTCCIWRMICKLWLPLKYVSAKHYILYMEDDLQTLTSFKICLSKALHAVCGGWFANSDFPQNMSQQSTTYCIWRMICKLWLPSKYVSAKHCMLCTPCSLELNLHSLCSVMWYRTWRVNIPATG